MTDAHVLDLLSPYLDGQVTVPEADLVRSHLASCPACSAELAALSTVRAALRALPAAAVPRSFALGPRAASPRVSALDGTVGGWARAITSLAASLLLVLMGVNWAVRGLPRQAPSTAAVAAPASVRPLAAPASAAASAGVARPVVAVAAVSGPPAPGRNGDATAGGAQAAAAAGGAGLAPGSAQAPAASRGGQGAAAAAGGQGPAPASAPAPQAPGAPAGAQAPAAAAAAQPPPSANAGAARQAPVIGRTPEAPTTAAFSSTRGSVPSAKPTAGSPPLTAPLFAGEAVLMAAALVLALASVRWWRR